MKTITDDSNNMHTNSNYNKHAVIKYAVFWVFTRTGEIGMIGLELGTNRPSLRLGN